MTALDNVDLAEVAASFGRLLHDAGVPVTAERTGCFVRGIACVRPASVTELYWAGRVTLLTGHDEIDVYDRVFAYVFRGAAHHADRPAAPPPVSIRLRPHRRVRTEGTTGASSGPATAPTPGGDAGNGTDPQLVAAASFDDRLRTKDFAAWTPEELALLRSLIAGLAVAAPLRRSRRHVRRRPGERLDLRATLRRSHRTGGDPVERVLRRRKQRPRRIVLLADVSGSMEPYARAYLHLLHGAVRATKAEAFVFATRLTRLTRELRANNPDRALQRAAAAAPDWSGGTRIGHALRMFNDRYGRRGMARGAVVVIVSDGWELDNPAVLGEQMARLGRLAHRVIWVNPRIANERYPPLVGGMLAALPHIDVMLSGHSPAAMAELLAAISDVEPAASAPPVKGRVG
jgi:uncharacterized protein with von Willebrand factor type A (vWA) domain